MKLRPEKAQHLQTATALRAKTSQEREQRRLHSLHSESQKSASAAKDGYGLRGRVWNFFCCEKGLHESLRQAVGLLSVLDRLDMNFSFSRLLYAGRRSEADVFSNGLSFPVQMWG